LTSEYPNGEEFFVARLAQGVGTLAAAFYPRDVIVRMSDFKTNEYAGLLGGEGFEPRESNPMIGFRGASRYYDERYREGFLLECRAMKKVREEMGLKNVKLMIPFCRTVEEGRRVLEVMAQAGVSRFAAIATVAVMATNAPGLAQVAAPAAPLTGVWTAERTFRLKAGAVWYSG
jgi:pyruvate,water dikinase